MWKAIPDIIKIAARNLRKNETLSEKLLWEKLRNKRIGLRIIRQAPIYVFTEDTWLDRYIIADFYCPSKKLIIELDGNIHEKQEIYLLDRAKEELLHNAWYRVLRFRNEEILIEISHVIQKIKDL